MAELTPYQTVGPFFDVGLCKHGAPAQLTASDTAGTRITVEGMVRDGAGAVVPDALIEVWQANAFGRYQHPEDDSANRLDETFDGFGRAPTDDEGRFRIDTVKPGRVAAPDGSLQAPHLALGVLARGMLTRLVTRVYFDDEPSTADDRILQLVPNGRRSTLIARRVGEGLYHFDIVLQGSETEETVFFDV